MVKNFFRDGSNGLLRRLPREVCGRLRRQMQRMDLAPGTVLAAQGQQQADIYFPRSGVVSILRVLENGDTTEMAMVGNEGVVGISLVVGKHDTTTRAVVQIAVEAVSISSDAMAHEFKQCSEIQALVLRYTQAMMGQMAQVIMCGSRHSVDMQLSRWLLLTLDRVDGDVLRVTHEAVAQALGVRRQGVTEALGELQNQGLIRCAREAIHVIDRPALEHSACECYRVVCSEYESLQMAPLRSTQPQCHSVAA